MKMKSGTIVAGSLAVVMWGCSQSDQPTADYSPTTNRVTRVPATTLPVTPASGYTTTSIPSKAVTNPANTGGIILDSAGAGTNVVPPPTNMGAVVQQTNVGTQVIAGALSGDQAENEIDLGIVQGIRKTLESDKELGAIAGKIRIACANGQVTLTGTVPDQLTKMTVTDKVKSVTGVKSVDNQLAIGA